MEGEAGSVYLCPVRQQSSHNFNVAIGNGVLQRRLQLRKGPETLFPIRIHADDFQVSIRHVFVASSTGLSKRGVEIGPPLLKQPLEGDLWRQRAADRCQSLLSEH